MTRLKPDWSKTCRFFRDVSKERHLWLTLAMSLDYDHAPNLAPHESLDSLSTNHLREMVIRAARSYANWNSPDGAKASRTDCFNVHHRKSFFKKLLPGGRYYAFQTSTQKPRFHCYDTQSQLEVSPRDGVAPPGARMALMDCILVDNGNALILAFRDASLVW